MISLFVATVVGATALWFAIYGEGATTVVPAGFVAALAMFVWRLRARLIYGLAEVAFGLFVLWDAAGRGRGDFSSDFSNDFSKFELHIAFAQTLAAIYVLIRGLDNCYQGSPKLRLMIDRWTNM